MPFIVTVKYIYRSAALLREVERGSPLLPLILCITSCLTLSLLPSELLPKGFLHCGIFISSRLCHLMMQWGYLDLKDDLYNV